MENLNLYIESGEMVAIRGVSGSGKTTLLSIIGCNQLDYTGTYNFKGKEVVKSDKESALFRKNVFGYIPQHGLLIEDLTVEKNILLPLFFEKNKKIKLKKAERVDELLESFEILNKKKSYVGDLSGGEKRRVAICRALINEPEVLLADGPTAALNDCNSEKLMSFFNKLRKKDKTIIIVTHDERVYKKCSRIIEIHDGNIPIIE
ncbi:MAG: ABC transporter ATP-binding protein [Lachnospirales bacterium]